MKIFILFIHLLMPYQAQDSLVPLPDLKAFTHPKFFVHDCKCGMFNPKYFQLEVYKNQLILTTRMYGLFLPVLNMGML